MFLLLFPFIIMIAETMGHILISMLIAISYHVEDFINDAKENLGEINAKNQK